MSAHAELSPSAAERWLNCTASVNYCKGVVEEESEHAAEGTRAHEALELWLTLGVPPEDGELYYWLLPTVEDALKLEKDGWDVEYEVRAKYDDRLWGTCDIRAIKGKKLKIKDYKHGYVPVEVANNFQLLTYVLCTEKELDTQFSDISVSIHQPRIPHKDGTHRDFTVSRELLDWYDEELHAAIRRIDDDPAFMAGKWCRYCARLGDCRTAVNTFGKLLTGKDTL